MDTKGLGLGVLEIVPRRYFDQRGFLAETWKKSAASAVGIDVNWVQENHSYSEGRHVLRGLHIQIGSNSQAKLVRVLRGSVLDVAVDLRPMSETFGKWVACRLSSDAFNQMYIPSGFAHGFLTLEPDVEILYKVSMPYAPDSERTIAWNDPDIGIDWGLAENEVPLLSPKDSQAPFLAELRTQGDV